MAMSKILLRVGAGIGVATILLGLVVTAEIGRFRLSVPDYDRSVRLAGPSAPVEIIRDEHAAPHIIAHSREDAEFGLGYVQAQDRLWQMVFLRAVMQARVSEIVGSPGVATDVFFRSLGLYRLAEQSFGHLNPESQRLLEAYASGVNAYIRTHKGPLPLEFSLLQVAPEPWRPADSIATMKYMQFSLSSNMYGELARMHLIGRLSKRQVEEFLPPYPGDPPNPLPDYISMFRSSRSAAIEAPDTTASDNWVVAGFRSVTGAPLLANDPHLPLTIPSIWYLAHLSWPGHDVVGGVLPGMPAVSVGHNRNMAWGLTNTGPDTQDLYLERLSPDGKSYVTPTGTEPFRVRRELIRVRFAEPVTLVVRSTRHGPVLPDDWRRIIGTVPKGYVLALSWTALSADDRTIQASLEMDDTAGENDFSPVQRDFLSPMQNVVFADKKHIGLLLASRIPIRGPANDSLGLVPGKGWDSRYDWKGYLATNELPRIDDPSSGQIATANNKTVPPGYPHELTREWDEPFRFWRIDQMLKDTRQHSLDSFKAIQLDTHERYADDLLPLLLKAGPWHAADAREAVERLTRWDRNMDASRPEPLIFEAWQRALVRRLFADELGDDFKSNWSHHAVLTLRVLRNIDGEARWCDDVTTKAREDCATEIRLALKDALAELRSTYGRDMTRWRWGEAHHAVFSNEPLGEFPVIGGLFNREVEASGGDFVLRRGGFRYASDRPYAAIHGSGYRAIYDLADLDSSLYVISTGESGNLFSRFYDDQIALWAGGAYYRIPTSPKAVHAAAKYRMMIQPLSASAP
jgi:penicillin amidase